MLDVVSWLQQIDVALATWSAAFDLASKIWRLVQEPYAFTVVCVCLPKA